MHHGRGVCCIVVDIDWMLFDHVAIDWVLFDHVAIDWMLKF